MAADVQPLITAAQSYAEGLVHQAESAMNAANALVAAVGYDIPVAHPVIFGEQPPKSTGLKAPTHPDIPFDVPPEPSETWWEFQNMDDLDLSGRPADLDTPRPTYVAPNKPSQLHEFTGLTPAVKTDFLFPDAPDELLHPNIEAPVIRTLTDADRPAPIGTLTIPAFDGVKPVDETVVPTDHQARFEGAFKGKTSEMVTVVDGLVDAMLVKRNPQYAVQMAAIETQLTRYLAGGTGLNATVETAIYERSKAKTNAEARRIQQAAISDMAARGFTMPTGAVTSALQQARQAGADNNAHAAREIVVLQAEMEQRNLQFAVTTSTALRTAMVQATLSYHQNLTTINGQALDYAKTVLSAIIEVFNTQVRMYGQQLEAYKAEAAVYDVKVRAAMVQVERYLAEIKGLEATVNYDKNRVEIYRARVEALNSYAAVYRAQVEAMQGRVGMERLRLDLFQSQVQSYTAEVQGKNAEWQGYNAAISGETAKIGAYSAQVQYYVSEWQGYKTRLEQQNEEMRNRMAHNQQKAAEYQAKVALFNGVVNARGAVASTKLAVQRQDVAAFHDEVNLALSEATLKHEYYKTKSGVDITNEAANLKAQIEGANSKREFGASIAALGNANSKAYAGMASAAMSGMNTLVGNIANQNT